MITFDAENRIFYLENEEMTYAFGIFSQNLTEHLWFGARTGHDLPFGQYMDCGGAHIVRLPVEDGSTVNPNQIPQEYHEAYAGDFGTPSLILERSNGSRRFDFLYEGYEILDEKPALPGLPSLRTGRSQTLLVHYRTDDVRMTQCYTVYEDCNAVVRSMTLHNLSDSPVKLRRAASFAFSLKPAEFRDMPDGRSEWQALYLAGGAGSEANVQRAPLSRGIFTINSRRGNSSASVNPFLSIVRPETTELSGPAYGVNLVWSGSFTLNAEITANRNLRLSGGYEETDFEWLLQPGETFRTPEAVLVYSADGISGMSRQFHHLYRACLIPERFVQMPRPVVINHWEATRFLFDGQRLRSVIDAAAQVEGIDAFILDDGWFGVREDATSGLGDWVVNEEKLGGSMAALSDYVHEKGLKFGLWFEPEMISRNSDLYRAHPDWAIQTPDAYALEGRGQLMLDLANPEVVDAIAEAVGRILRTNRIEIVKWDCNRDLTEGFAPSLPAERQSEMNIRRTLGFYALCEKLIAGNPQILFEGCASGGGRFDAGMLYYFPQIWTSDQTDVQARTFIQYGTSLCYPLSSQSCHVTRSPNRRAGHVTPLASRADIAMLGAFGYELDIGAMQPEEIAVLPQQVRAYRADEDLVLNGDLYRLSSPAESNFFAFQLVSPDRSRARITVMKELELYSRSQIRLCPQGLEETALYFCPELGRTMEGRSWMHFGFHPSFPQGDFLTNVYHFTKQ